MKKINYIIAIASVAAMTLVSCKGVSESVSKSSGEEVSTEQTSDQTTEGEEATEEVKIEDLKELTCDNYTIAIPEGWKASSKMVRSSCNMTLKENPHSTAMVNYTLYSENDLAESIAKRGCKAIPDITVGDKTYKVFENEKDVRDMNPDQALLMKLPGRLQNVTARGSETDCVSRSFCPKVAVPEDPVCGSAHCQIGDYWAGELGKPVIRAYQASRRGGYLTCEVKGNGRISISGEAVLVAVADIVADTETV